MRWQKTKIWYNESITEELPRNRNVALSSKRENHSVLKIRRKAKGNASQTINYKVHKTYFVLILLQQRNLNTTF